MFDFFSPDSVDQLRFAIKEADGNEIFVLGQTDAERRVVQIEVLARGSETSVPAILKTCGYGDVVIHNHPSGDLRPSAADIEVASQFGSLGVGFYIVSNALDNLYRMVEAFAEKDMQEISPEQIAKLLGPDGVIAGKLSDYEDRPEQLRMAFAVSAAFNKDQLAVVEAGTGVGKSLAYLLPAAAWAQLNSVPVVVSTNTRNLQSQLMEKDLPLVKQVIDQEKAEDKAPLKVALLKGRTNYLCLRQLGVLIEFSMFEFERPELRHFAREVVWALQTEDGDLDNFAGLGHANPAFLSKLASSGEECSGRACRYY
jgi:ATP-dependent DNA helicase DinG